MKKILYKETQYFTTLIVLVLVCVSFILVAAIFQWGSRPLPLGVGITLGLVMLLISVGFYKLTTVITEDEASFIFGYGPIKRTIALNDLELTAAEIVNTSLLAGVGYRITARGTLFNSHPGSSLYVPTKDGGSEFFVGTKYPDELLNVIKELA